MRLAARHAAPGAPDAMRDSRDEDGAAVGGVAAAPDDASSAIEEFGHAIRVRVCVTHNAHKMRIMLDVNTTRLQLAAKTQSAKVVYITGSGSARPFVVAKSRRGNLKRPQSVKLAKRQTLKNCVHAH